MKVQTNIKAGDNGRIVTNHNQTLVQQPAPIRIANHNQTLVQPLPLRVANHNQTLVRGR
jgi:hypothetical protein